jgi:hypothetical protein
LARRNEEGSRKMRTAQNEQPVSVTFSRQIVEADGTAYPLRVDEVYESTLAILKNRSKERLSALNASPQVMCASKLPNGYCYVDKLEDFYIFVAVTYLDQAKVKA